MPGAGGRVVGRVIVRQIGGAAMPMPPPDGPMTVALPNGLHVWTTEV